MKLGKPSVLIRSSLPLAMVFAGLSACYTPGAITTPQPEAVTEVPAEAKASEDKDLSKQLEDKRFELECKRAEIKIERLEREADARSSKASIDDAELRRKKAAALLENFNKVEKPQELAQLALRLDRGQQRIKEEEEELNELLAMYKGEDFADLTKELVINRAKAAIEFAKRDFELTKKSVDNTRDFELAQKLQGLEQDLLEAERNLREAKEKDERAKLKVQLEVKKTEREVDQLEKALAELEKKAKAKEPKP